MTVTSITPTSIAKTLIERWEGCKLLPYRDVRGIPTIGTGFCSWDGSQVTMGTPAITQEACDTYLETLLTYYATGTQSVIKHALTVTQHGALISLGYNVGLTGFRNSELAKCINNHDAAGTKVNWLDWDHAGGVVCKGLSNRRQDEFRVWLGAMP